MLPASNRLSRSRDFQQAVRRGRRAGRATLVVHLLLPEPRHPGDPDPVPVPPRAGLVVSRRVGGSVVRSTVARRLRHVIGPRLAHLPAGSRLVVRALPPAADASSSALAGDLDDALRRCGFEPTVGDEVANR